MFIINKLTSELIKCSYRFLFHSKQCKVLSYITHQRFSTIFALSSGSGKCGVAVVRVSGEKARDSIFKMTKAKLLPTPRKSVLRRIIHPISGEILDKGMVLWFPAPKSFTGEDCVEFHIHGGIAVCKAVLEALGKLPDFTPAEPGDFTKRAFYNGKLDLTSVEGLGDLIHAETEAQRKQAFRQMDGSLCKLYSTWRDLILRSRANIEAFIDFSEEDNIEQDVLLDVRRNIETLITEISSHLKDSRKGERLRSGVNLVIVGRPNVGKSSFLNALVQRPAAIVSPIAGTTRDVVQVHFDFGGFPVNINDTAGLRETGNVIEVEGIKRAMNEVRQADIALIIVEAKDLENEINKIEKFNMEKFVSNYFNEVGFFNRTSTMVTNLNQNEWLQNKNYLLIMNKIDLITSNCKEKLVELSSIYNNICPLSLLTFDGFEDTLIEIKKMCETLCGSNSIAESPYLTSQRQKTHIQECLNHLQAVIGEQDELDDECSKAVDMLGREDKLVLAAQRLLLASNQLGYVTGHITTEQVLDYLFSAFCIGK